MPLSQPLMLPLTILISSLLLGLTLLALGLHGRRINSHRICRKCKFDLEGLTDPANCPECGADLTQRRSTRTGERRRRRTPLTLGVILTTIALLLGGTQVALFIAGTKVNSYKPVWMLLNEADGPDSRRTYAAFQELESRIQSQTPSTRTIRRIIDRALKEQAHRTNSWRPEWGRLVEISRKRGVVPDTTWHRYARQSLVLTATARPLVRLGDPLVVQIMIERRVAKYSLLSARLMPIEWTSEYHPSGMVVCYDDAPLDTALARWSGTDPLMEVHCMPIRHAGGLGPTPELGHRSIQVHFNVRVVEGRGTIANKHVGDIEIEGPWPNGVDPAAFRERSPWYGNVGLVSWNERYTLPIQLVAAGTHTVQLATDPALREAMRSMFAKALISVPASSSGEYRVNLYCNSPPAPAPLAFDAYARLRNGTEHLIDSVVTPRDKWPSCVRTNRTNPDDLLGEQSVTLILRPNPDRAVNTMMQEIWGEEITIENVPVQ